MVNNISGYNYSPYVSSSLRTATSAYALHNNEVENLVKFLNGQPINTSSNEPTITESIKSTVPMLGIFGGIQLGSELKKNKWNIKQTISTANAASPYSKRGDAFQAARTEVSKKFKDVFNGSVAVDPKRGFIGKCLDKVPGYKRLRASGFGQMMGNKGTGAGWMGVIDGAIETMTQVVPTFKQVGTAEGFKQIAKSGTKVIAGTAGWVAGDVAGRAIGAAIGTAIFPGVGTAVGSFIGGFMGGIIGSAVASKVAKSVTGPSELEIFNKKKMEETVNEINNNPETKTAIAQQAYQKAEEVLAQDPENKDALASREAALKILNKVPNTQPDQMSNQNYPAAQNIQQTDFNSLTGIPVVPGFNGIDYDLNIYRQSLTNANSQTYANPFAQKLNQQKVGL